ncbi:transcriptional regulator, AbrB family [Desulfofarcimen acetoxidans DSM 771]|uniref:Transcriptional regulator, AbrB family n=1 Tax=Desulfofarcimen acetoxidans (strain ATCC 49208 / DSM 771 / KCTC 5769 / VKM B-1644 / 5575) TaxID=485916 RepID=C8W4U2_DESAS|nr:AbrB/MazE/SpoVT family DNA-binding domain-containing protein [Desulfofarcimen acetoxidans]ACV63978.1 transcriptional regulator, AbrB family [Desulfofarcimen acetoxidans DSM 771]
MFGVSEEVKVGTKSQVVIPAKIRNSAKIGPGDILIISSDRNNRISLMKKPDNWSQAAFGCCKGVWGDKSLEYLEKERTESWEE